MNVSAEADAQSTKLVARAKEPVADSTRASASLRFIAGGIAAPAPQEQGITIVIPELGHFGFSPLSAILRAVAFGLDWTQLMIPSLWGAKQQSDKEQELRELVRNLNSQVIELRREVMLKEEELRKRKHAGL
jgi:hypothetical protein